MPEPTKTPSAPSCIMSAASAGVATPPAAKLTTGRRPFSCTKRTSSTSTCRRPASSKARLRARLTHVANLRVDGTHVAHCLHPASCRCSPAWCGCVETLPRQCGAAPRPGRAPQTRHRELGLVDVVGNRPGGRGPRTHRCSRCRWPGAPEPPQSGQCGTWPSRGWRPPPGCP